MQILQSMAWWELVLYGALLLAGLVLIFWYWFKGKP